MPATKLNIADLVAQMPDVDPPVPPRRPRNQESTAQAQPPPVASEPPAPPPDPNRPGKFTGPDPARAHDGFAAILNAGRAALDELLNLVHAPGDAAFVNYKAGYVLHGLAIYAGASGQEKQRRLLAKTIAARLNSSRHSSATKAFFIQELQTVGGEEAISALGKHLLDDELCEPATRALLAIRNGAVVQIRKALPKTKGRNRLNLFQAAGLLGDKRSVGPLKHALGDDDSNIRVTAAWALANIGDQSAIDSVLHYATPTEGWERIQATDACLRFAEKLQANGRKADADRILQHLRSPRVAPQV